MLTFRRVVVLLAALAGVGAFLLPRSGTPSPMVLLTGALAGIAVLGCGMSDWGGDRRRANPSPQLTDADCLRDAMRSQSGGGPSRGYLLLLDVDNFHRVNRDYGRNEGDRVLQAVTHTLRLHLRNTDLLCRYAGDRFAVLLSDSDADTARALAAHLRCAIASMRHHALRSGQAIPVSVRWAAGAIDADPHQALRELNRALERPMHSGAQALLDESPLQTH